MKYQIKMKRWLWILIAGLFATVAASAQSSSIGDLKPVFERLKSIKSYSYETLTTAVFPNGQKDQQHNHVYMDRLNKKFSYKSEQQTVMLKQQVFLIFQNMIRSIKTNCHRSNLFFSMIWLLFLWTL
jgi:outer membrane lipoprotein-sorting protein